MGTKNACGVAADTLYKGQLTILRSRPGARSTASLTISVSNPGRITITQAAHSITLIRTVGARARSAGRITIMLSPTATAHTKLRTQPSVAVRVQVRYLPDGGITSTTTTTVVLSSALLIGPPSGPDVARLSALHQAGRARGVTESSRASVRLW